MGKYTQGLVEPLGGSKWRAQIFSFSCLYVLHRLRLSTKIVFSFIQGTYIKVIGVFIDESNSQSFDSKKLRKIERYSLQQLMTCFVIIHLEVSRSHQK
jgi:cytochrome b561